ALLTTVSSALSLHGALPILLETPQVVNVVTRPQMDAQGANSVAQALRYTPGVNAEPNGYDIRYDWLDIRGFNTFGNTWLDGLMRSEEHTSELQSRENLVCRL